MRGKIEFKSCSCGMMWLSREAFVRDLEIIPIGMTFDRESDRQVLFFFNHERCGNTLAIEVSSFADLIEEPVCQHSMLGTRECEGKCAEIKNLLACEAECRNAPFRRLLADRIVKRDI
jgi:hypothetical protein